MKDHTILLGCVAYLTLWERKVIGWMQVRLGPNRVTFFGIRWLGGWAQPIADGLKLLVKEIIVPTGANKFLFVLAPIMAIMPALAAWAVIPFSDTLVLADIDAGLLYILAMTSMGVYGIILAGWASNSSVRAPHWARTCAMPRPMVPVPNTAATRSGRERSNATRYCPSNLGFLFSMKARMPSF